MKIIIEHGEYKGSPTLSLRNDTVEQKYPPFTFGLSKAKLIQAALKQDPDFLDKFISENTTA